MAEYNYTATVDDDDHGDRYGVATLLVEIDPLTGRAVQAVEEATEEDEEAEEDADVVLVRVICSCGSISCGAIRRYGHPEPVYEAEIQPLPSQFARDQRAVALHGGAL